MEADTSKKFSPSKLDTYKDCPRRYRYRYVDKIRRETQSVEAFVGSCVHKAFEELYRGLVHGKTLSEEETAAVFAREWDSRWSPAIVIRDPQYSPADWKKVGEECVRTYYRRHQPFTEDRTVEVEKRVGFPLEAAGERILIEGFIDRLALGPDGAFEIHDYKTSRSLPPQKHADEDWQLAIYDAAVRAAWPDAKGVRLVWHYVRHGRELISSRTPEQIAALKGEIAALIETIRRDHEFSPRKSPLCDWCEYRDICPLWSHAEKLAALTPEERSADAGAGLVDELAALDARKRVLRDELKGLERDQKSVEEALLRFAEAKGLLAVAGRDGEAAIVEKEEWKFPTKTHSPEALEALERELKEAPLWREVSHLDSHRLIEGYKRKEWSAETIRLIEGLLGRYAKRVPEKSVRFHRKKEARED